MIRTVPIEKGLTALLRSEFTELLDANGNHRHDKDGQPLYSANIFVSGGLRSPFAQASEAGPAEIRLRTIGRPTVTNGVVRLDGDIRLSTWSQRNRGVVRTDVTITAERVSSTTDRPQMRGPLSVAWPDVPICFLDYVPPTRPGEPGLATVGVAEVAGSPWIVDGLGEVSVAVPPADDLFPGTDIVLHDLVAAFFVPDEGGRDAARLILGCSRIEPRNTSTGGRHRKAEPVPTPEPEPVAG